MNKWTKIIGKNVQWSTINTNACCVKLMKLLYARSVSTWTDDWCKMLLILLTGRECEHMQHWWWFEGEAQEIPLS